MSTTVLAPMLLLLLLLRPASTQAGDANFDATFASGGVFTTSLSDEVDRPAAVAVQPDGRILVAGSYGASVPGAVTTGFVLRLTDAGALDPTFGVGGVVRLPGGTAAADLALQPDGRILVAGAASTGVLVARLLADGARDPAFGTAGIVTSVASGPAVAVAVQPDGRILVAGGDSAPGDDAFVVLRYEPDGSFDGGFGSGGVARVPVADAAFLLDMVLQPDGAIVLGGRTTAPVTGGVLVRLLPSGVVDVGFAGGGLADLSGTMGGVSSLALQSDGSILAAGVAAAGGFPLAVARLTATGSADGAFVLATIPVFGGRAAMLVRPDDRIVVAAWTDGRARSAYGQPVVWRLTATGAPDTTFAPLGRAEYDLSDLSGSVTAVAQQADGKVLVLGAMAAGDDPRTDVRLLRLGGGPCGNGTLDAGEGCDDGNAATGDCCSPGCALEAAGAWCRDLDGDACTASRCDGAGTCADGGVATTCVAATKARLAVRDEADDRKDGLVWTASGGDTRSTRFFVTRRAGDTRFTLCVFGGATPALLARAFLPDEPSCQGQPCWSGRGRGGFRYRDREALADGIGDLVLSRSGRGPKIKLKGRGFLLDTPPPPLSLPVRVQLHASTGACWESTHASPQQNGPGRFEAH